MRKFLYIPYNQDGFLPSCWYLFSVIDLRNVSVLPIVRAPLAGDVRQGDSLHSISPKTMYCNTLGWFLLLYKGVFLYLQLHDSIYPAAGSKDRQNGLSL